MVCCIVTSVEELKEALRFPFWFNSTGRQKVSNIVLINDYYESDTRRPFAIPYYYCNSYTVKLFESANYSSGLTI